MKIDMRERFLRMREVVHRTGMSRVTIYNKIHAGTFPKQIPIGANLVFWLESDVQKWMQEQIDKKEGLKPLFLIISRRLFVANTV